MERKEPTYIGLASCAACDTEAEMRYLGLSEYYYCADHRRKEN